MIWPCVFIIMIPRSGANDATRTTNTLYALQKSCDCPIITIAIWKQRAEELYSSLVYQLQFILFFFLLAELL